MFRTSYDEFEDDDIVGDKHNQSQYHDDEAHALYDDNDAEEEENQLNNSFSNHGEEYAQDEPYDDAGHNPIDIEGEELEDNEASFQHVIDNARQQSSTTPRLDLVQIHSPSPPAKPNQQSMPFHPQVQAKTTSNYHHLQHIVKVDNSEFYQDETPQTPIEEEPTSLRTPPQPVQQIQQPKIVSTQKHKNDEAEVPAQPIPPSNKPNNISTTHNTNANVRQHAAINEKAQPKINNNSQQEAPKSPPAASYSNSNNNINIVSANTSANASASSPSAEGELTPPEPLTVDQVHTFHYMIQYYGEEFVRLLVSKKWQHRFDAIKILDSKYVSMSLSDSVKNVKSKRKLLIDNLCSAMELLLCDSVANVYLNSLDLFLAIIGMYLHK